MTRLLRIGLKDLLVQVRDLPALAVMLAMPMVLIFILGSALGGMGGESGIARIDVAVVNEDGSATAQRVAEAFTGSEELKELFDVHAADSAEDAREGVQRGDLAAALIIPEGFGAEVEAARSVEMQVLTDPGQATTAAIFSGVVRSIGTRISAASVAAQTTGELLGESRMMASADEAMRYVNEAAEAVSDGNGLQTIQVSQADAKGSEEGFDALDYYAGAMSVMFLLFGAMFGAFSVVRERRDQTLARVLSTPTARWSIVGGKMFGVFVIGLLQFAALYAFTSATGVDWGPSPLGVWLLITGELLAVTGLSVTLSAVSKNERQVGAIGPVAIQILAAVGGSFIPLAVFPEWLRPLHYATPNGLALDGIEALRAGSGLAAVLPNVGGLVVIAAVFAAVGVWRLRLE